MSKPKRHHIVPQFYLKQWRDPNQPKRHLLWIADKDTLKGNFQQPNNIFVETHYFTEQGFDSTHHAPTEALLSINESDIAPILPRLEAGQPTTEVEQVALWNFVLAMFARASWFRKLLQDYLGTQALAEVVSKTKHRAAQKVNERLKEGTCNRAERRKLLQSSRNKIDRFVETESLPLLGE